MGDTKLGNNRVDQAIREVGAAVNKLKLDRGLKTHATRENNGSVAIVNLDKRRIANSIAEELEE